MKKFTNLLLAGLLLFSVSVDAAYFIVRNADNVVTNVTASDPGAAPALHTKYNETFSIDISGWNSTNHVITRTGVNTYVTTPTVFQQSSFLVDDSDDSKIILPRTTGTNFDFSTAFTIIIPYKANWVTGAATTYLFDLKTAFYLYMDSAGTRLQSRIFDATTNSTTNTTFTALADGEWVWVGLTYDGAGGWQFIVNGSLVANSNIKQPVNNTETFRFGERWGYTVSQDMTMGNVLILNKVISAGELTSYYNGGVGAPAHDVFAEGDILHYYCADNFVGQTAVPDDSGVAATMRSALDENGVLTTTDVPN